MPVIIAHRGASAHLPGHKLEACAVGIEQGADYIEPDLVMTKDNVLICRHDRFLSVTTNISDHEEFAKLLKRYPKTPMVSDQADA